VAGDIVLGYDGSDGAKAALAVALTVARAFDAPLTIAFGYDVNPLGGEVADYRERVEALGRDMLAQAVALAAERDPGVTVEALVVPQRPVDSLLAVAAARRARVIVVGENGATPIMGAILGSVVHKLLHRTTLPVLVVPVPPDA